MISSMKTALQMIFSIPIASLKPKKIARHTLTCILKSKRRFQRSWKSWASTHGLMVIGAHLLMLGGAFFNRKSLLKTTGIGILGFVLFATIMEKLHLMNKQDTDCAVLLITIVMVIVGVVVSYRRFSRRTVMGYKR